MSKVISNIVVDHGTTIQATVVRDPSRSPFVLRSIVISDDETGSITNCISQCQGFVTLRHFGADDDVNGSAHSVVSFKVDHSDEEGVDWIIRASNGVEGEPYAALDRYIDDPNPMTSFAMFFTVPEAAFVASADRHFTVTVGLAKGVAPSVIRYVTGTITLESFGVPTFTWTQL
jgi:hypothetical protein